MALILTNIGMTDLILKLQETNTQYPQYTVTIPTQIVKARGFKKGERFILLEKDNGDLILKPLR